MSHFVSFAEHILVNNACSSCKGHNYLGGGGEEIALQGVLSEHVLTYKYFSSKHGTQNRSWIRLFTQSFGGGLRLDLMGNWVPDWSLEFFVFRISCDAGKKTEDQECIDSKFEN